MNLFEGRRLYLKNKLNRHLRKLTGHNIDFFSKLTQADIIELKTVLADINNFLTFQPTISAVKWIFKYFKIDAKTRREIIVKIDNTKPNSKGFDIHIPSPYNIIAEVKCTSPVNNGGKFGAAQWNSILDDVIKLRNGRNTILEISRYYKFLFLADLGDRTDQAISHLLKISRGTSNKDLRRSRHDVKKHLYLFDSSLKLNDLKCRKIYLKTIKL
jgi:hypothetical protein